MGTGLCRALTAAGLAAVCGRGSAQVLTSPKSVGNVFIAGRPIRFTSIGTFGAAVRVTDYSGKVVREVGGTSGTVTLNGLSDGYYEIQSVGSSGSPTPFVVVPRPELRADGRIAVDAALSWQVAQDRYDEGAELIRRAGTRWVRDRIDWGEVESERGRFVWTRYDRSANAQTRRGLAVYQVFHLTPKWARTDGDRARFPDDLRDVYTFARAAARHFGGRVKAWEVWNEADMPQFSPDPASEYAAFLKAAYLGFKSARPDLPITQTSFALSAKRFAPALEANGTAAFYDIFNYHVYDDPARYADRAAFHELYRMRSGAFGKPVWLTEAGIDLPLKGKRLSADEERRQAEFVPKSCVESLVHGTDKHFFFLLPHYVENGVEFGVWDADWRPYPAYAALATVANELGEANYKGEIRFQQPGLHLHVFDNGEGETLVAWSDASSVRVPLTLPRSVADSLRKAIYRDVVGTPHRLFPDDLGGTVRLALSPSAIYVRAPRGTFAVTPPPLRPKPTVGPPHYPHREIVVRLRPVDPRSDKSAEAFRFRPGAAVRLEAQIYNFGAKDFSGNVELTAPPGWTLSLSRIAVERLKPLDRVVESVTLTPADSNVKSGNVTAAAVSPDGDRGSPAVVAFVADP